METKTQVNPELKAAVELVLLACRHASEMRGEHGSGGAPRQYERVPDPADYCLPLPSVEQVMAAAKNCWSDNPLEHAIMAVGAATTSLMYAHAESLPEEERPAPRHLNDVSWFIADRATGEALTPEMLVAWVATLGPEADEK